MVMGDDLLNDLEVFVPANAVFIPMIPERQQTIPKQYKRLASGIRSRSNTSWIARSDRKRFLSIAEYTAILEKK